REQSNLRVRSHGRLVDAIHGNTGGEPVRNAWELSRKHRYSLGGRYWEGVEQQAGLPRGCENSSVLREALRGLLEIRCLYSREGAYLPVSPSAVSDQDQRRRYLDQLLCGL